MWRVQGFVGRVLHRCYSSTPLRLHQNHHVEDEVINSSSVLSTSRHSSITSSQKEEEGGGRRKKQRTSQFGYADLPAYTALDAVGLGAAAVLFMQLCRRIHSQLSSGNDQPPIPGARTPRSATHKCGYRVLLEILARRDVLPRGRSVLCLQGAPESHNTEQASTSSSSSSSAAEGSVHSVSEEHHLTPDSPSFDQQGAPLSHRSATQVSSPLQNDANTETRDAGDEDMLSGEKTLAGAAQNLKQVGESSIPVILNIMGIESTKNKNYKEAFTCFEAAAELGYCKAQFNVGVCYETGRGVAKDKEKALHYYQLAAAGGHREAGYRWAKLLLSSRGIQSLEELNAAIELLEQSAAAGFIQAQVCLASVYSQEPVRDGRKSVHHLKMAAERGDDGALLLLGQCYEKGFGVRKNLKTAIECYSRAAQAGNKQAKRLLTPPSGRDIKAEDAVLRSIRSAPCFFAAERRLQLPLSSLASPAVPGPSVPLSPLPHSWSTGSLCVPYEPASVPLYSTEGRACQWSVGIG